MVARTIQLGEEKSEKRNGKEKKRKDEREDEKRRRVKDQMGECDEV